MAQNLPKTMKAVGFFKYLPISAKKSFVDLELSLPTVLKNDVLVEVKATAVNPIDAKKRSLADPATEDTPKILGWDGAGLVVAKGEDAKLFNVGDEVFFTGDLRRTGSNSQYATIDEIMVGPKPKNLSFEQAAAIPLTALTAYESLYDRLLISEKDKGKSILILNSAGGVGSIASQLAKNSGLTVIGTASRQETNEFTRQFGADVVINHSQDIVKQLEGIGYGNGVDYILVNYDPFPYWNTLIQAVKPQGKICLLVDSSGPVEIKQLKDKSATLVYEMMITRLKHNTEDKFRSHEILKTVSKMLEEGKLKTTLTKTLSPINAENLREAHRLIEENRMIGKLVLSGF